GELSAGRQTAFDSAATRHRDAARLLASRGDLEGALAKLRELAPEHPTMDAEIKAVGLAIQRRNEDRANAEKKRQEEEKARLEAERKRAEEERLRAETERKRQEQLRLEAEEAE